MRSARANSWQCSRRGLRKLPARAAVVAAARALPVLDLLLLRPTPGASIVPMQLRTGGARSSLLVGRQLRRAQQCQFEQFQAALGCEHDLSLHSFCDGIVLDDLQCEFWVLVVVVTVLPDPLISLRVHVHARTIPVRLETRGDFSRERTRDAFDGKTGSGHGFGKRTLG